MLWEAYLRSAIYAFICVIGIIGNIFVMFFFGFKMKRAANFRWFVIHLAIADCAYAILSPMQMLYLIFSNGQWQLGTVLCKMSYIGPITINVSAFIMCFMAFERYRAICYPFGERLSKRFINSMVTLIWIVCILLKVPVIYRLNVDGGECILLTSSNTEYLLIGISFLVFESVLPLTLLYIFFVQITIALKKHSCFREHSDSHRTVEEYKRQFSNTGETSSTDRQHLPPPSIKIFTTDFEHDASNSHTSLLMGTPSNRREQVHFSLRRGLLYSGNDDIDSHNTKSSKTSRHESHEGSSFFTPPQSPNSLNAENHHHYTNLLTNNFRNSYTVLKEFVKHHSLSGEPKLFGVKDKNDRATISALFLSVAMFTITSVPYNLYYFIITCLFLYHPNVDLIFLEYGQTLIVVNEWLGVLMLSGCIMNIIVYSGKFPQFRHQAYIWMTQFRRNLSEAKNLQEMPSFNPSVCNSSSNMAASYYKGKQLQRPRSQNNYITV